MVFLSGQEWCNAIVSCYSTSWALFSCNHSVWNACRSGSSARYSRWDFWKSLSQNYLLLSILADFLFLGVSRASFLISGVAQVFALHVQQWALPSIVHVHNMCYLLSRCVLGNIAVTNGHIPHSSWWGHALQCSGLSKLHKDSHFKQSNNSSVNYQKINILSFCRSTAIPPRTLPSE